VPSVRIAEWLGQHKQTYTVYFRLGLAGKIGGS